MTWKIAENTIKLLIKCTIKNGKIREKMKKWNMILRIFAGPPGQFEPRIGGEGGGWIEKLII